MPWALRLSARQRDRPGNAWRSYKMPSATVDGMSPEAVRDAIAEAAERGRKGEGPTLLDIQTYRYKGHSMSDPQKYRTKDEVASYVELRPHRPRSWHHPGEQVEHREELKAVEKEVKAQVEEAIKFAEESPLPDASELYEDVYMQSDYPFVND